MKLLNLEPSRFSSSVVSRLRNSFDYTELSGNMALEEAIGDTEVILTKLNYCIDKTILNLAPRLRFIATPTTGLTHIDVEAAHEQHVRIISLKGDYIFLKSITATAEFAWGLLLSLSRCIPFAFLDVCGGRWDRNHFIGEELSGKTLGIIGLGRLGSIVAEYGRVFRMNVIASDPNPSCGNPDNVQLMDLDDLLRNSDYVSIHVDLNQSTRRLLGDREFSLMKKNCRIINTSRGEVLDETALLAALEEGRIAGAALDVLSSEFSEEKDWINKNELIKYARLNKNLILTPHLGGATWDSMEKADRRITDLLIRAKNERSE